MPPTNLLVWSRLSAKLAVAVATVLVSCSGCSGTSSERRSPRAVPTTTAAPLGIVEDTGQAAASSCKRLLTDFTRTGICQRGSHRYAVGARGDAVRVGGTQISVASIDLHKVLRGDEEIPDKRAKGHWLLVELRVAAVGNRPLRLPLLELYGNLIQAGRQAIGTSQWTALAGRADHTTDHRIAAGQERTIVLVYDINAGVMRRLARTPRRDNLKRPGVTLRFIDSQRINARDNGNQVADSSHIGVVRLPPLPSRG